MAYRLGPLPEADRQDKKDLSGMIKNLLIMLARVRPNLTKIWYTYYVYLAQMCITKILMSKLVWKKLWPDTIGQNR